MHGTFRSHIVDGTTVSVSFDARPVAAPPSRARRGAKVTALLAGCCLLALPIYTSPRHLPPAAGPEVAQRQQVRNAAELPAPHPLVAASAAKVAAPPVAAPKSVARTPAPEAAPPFAVVIPIDVQPLPVELPQPMVAITDEPLPPPPVLVSLPDTPRVTSADAAPTAPAAPPIMAQPLAAPALVVDLPGPAADRLASLEPPPAPVPDNPQAGPQGDALRPVDVAQISEPDVRSVRVPELQEPGLAVGGDGTLAAKIAAMQVTLPPPARLRDSDRAMLLAEAPTQMVVRIGGDAVGRVDFRVTDARTIDVKLADLLDVLAGHFEAPEFARLRTSAAAEAYVGFDQLRAAGLKVRYDPVYDELRIDG